MTTGVKSEIATHPYRLYIDFLDFDIECRVRAKEVYANDRFKVGALTRTRSWVVFSGGESKLIFEAAPLEKDLTIEVRRLLSQAVRTTGPSAAAKTLRTVLRATEQALAAKDFTFVEEVLKQFDPAEFAPVVSLGLLRSTYRAKSRLGGHWGTFLVKVYKHIGKVRDNAEFALRGLLPSNGCIAYRRE
jgi:hypothetical protein